MQRLKYNLLALAGALLGILNSVLVWRLFGAGPQADAWLVTAAMAIVLNLLSQCSVEQFLIFYAEAKSRSHAFGESFAWTSIIWCVVFGVALYVVCAVFSNVLVDLFVSASATEVRVLASQIAALQLTQIMCAPLTHLARQSYNLEGKFGKSYLIGFAFTATMNVFLGAYTLFGIVDIYSLALGVAAASAIQFVACLIVLRKHLFKSIINDWTFFTSFIKNSVSLRLAHSIHNFFCGVILNNAFSTLGVGYISSYQYAKKFADGLGGIAVGPQANIYQVRLSLNWLDRTQPLQFKTLATQYLKLAVPVFLVMAIATAIAMPELLKIAARSASVESVSLIKHLFLLSAIWQGVILVESIFSNIAIVKKSTLTFWIVNSAYAIALFLLLHVLTAASTPSGIIIVATSLQAFSTLCYGLTGWRSLKQRQAEPCPPTINSAV